MILLGVTLGGPSAICAQEDIVDRNYGIDGTTSISEKGVPFFLGYNIFADSTGATYLIGVHFFEEADSLNYNYFGHNCYFLK